MKKIALITLLCLLTTKLFSQQAPASISSHLPFLKDLDTVKLLVYKYGRFDYLYSELQTEQYAIVKNGSFCLKIPGLSNHPYECALVIPNLPRELKVLVEPGDQIEIQGNKISIKYSGIGSRKLNIRSRIDSIFDVLHYDVNLSLKSRIELQWSKVKRAEAYLNSKKSLIDKNVYNLNLIYIQNQFFTVPYVFLVYTKLTESEYYLGRNTLIKYFQPLENQLNQSIANGSAVYSSNFFSLINCKYYSDRILKRSDFELQNYQHGGFFKDEYNYIKKRYTGRLRERLITELLLNHSRSNDLGQIYDEAIGLIVNKDFRRILQERCSQIPGSPAYNFTLLDTNNITHHLKDYRGKILVLDFWFTGCGNCRELTPKLKIIEEYFKDKSDVIFVSISSDKNKKMWQNSIGSGLYTTSASEINLYTGGKGEKDPFYQKINFVGAPTLKLIDKNGNWCENPVDCRQDNGKDLIAKIEKALKD